MNRIIKKIIDGKTCDCYEVGDTGKMRLQLEGTFSENISRESLLLVPLSFSEAELRKIHDFWLTEQEFSLGLPLGESCSSASFWVGSNDSSKDASITNTYDSIVDHVTRLPQIKDPQDERLPQAEKRIYHTSQESKLLFWISAEFGYETQLSLCGQVRMQNKDDEDFLFFYPSIKDALLSWENELLDDREAYRDEIAFIEKLRSSSDMNTRQESQKPQSSLYRGFEITTCVDTGIERFSEDSKRTVICNGYYCRVYPAGDDQLAYQLDDFCLAEGYEIPDCSEASLAAGIIKYIDDMYVPLRKASNKIIATHNDEFSHSANRWGSNLSDKAALYHVTLFENIPSIRAQGLVPQIGERSIEGQETTPGIYLFQTVEDMEDALSGWLGEWYADHYGEDCTLAILQVHLPSDVQLDRSSAAYEVICRTVIPFKWITVFDEQGRKLATEAIPSKVQQQPLTPFTASLDAVIHQAESNKPVVISENNIAEQNDPIR